MITIMARNSSQARTAPQLRQMRQYPVGPGRKQPGRISYDLFQDAQYPLEFAALEQWADEAAADAPTATSHVADAIARAGSLRAQPPQIHRFTQLA